MTLNDLNGHFTLNFYYYELTLSDIIYLYAVESVYIHTWPGQMCGSGVVDRDQQNIWNPRKNCCIVETLINKANISISYYLVPYHLYTDSKTRDFELPWVAILR